MTKVGDVAGGLYDRLVRREPVLVFGTIGLWIAAAADIDPTSAVGIALASTVLLFQRAFSTAKVTAEENAAGQRYVGAVEHQAVAASAEVIALKAQAA